MKVLMLLGSSQTKHRVIVSRLQESRWKTDLWFPQINGTESSGTILLSDMDGSSTERPKLMCFKTDIWGLGSFVVRKFSQGWA